MHNVWTVARDQTLLATLRTAPAHLAGRRVPEDQWAFVERARRPVGVCRPRPRGRRARRPVGVCRACPKTSGRLSTAPSWPPSRPRRAGRPLTKLSCSTPRRSYCISCWRSCQVRRPPPPPARATGRLRASGRPPAAALCPSHWTAIGSGRRGAPSRRAHHKKHKNTPQKTQKKIADDGIRTHACMHNRCQLHL